MAILLGGSTKARIFLKSFHRFGRSSRTVDTQLSDPQISRIHGIIEWQDGQWQIRDLSKNGTWVNERRLKVNCPTPLRLADSIRFTPLARETFYVHSLTPPQDLLISLPEPDLPASWGNDTLVLDGYHLLPTDRTPEIAVYFDLRQGKWCCEELSSGKSRVIEDAEEISFDQRNWRLFRVSGNEADHTESRLFKPSELVFTISLSQDEERTEIKVCQHHRVINLSTRTHHYLIALLARHRLRAQHTSPPLDELAQGWVSVKQLAIELGLDSGHVNMLIHRARQQFINKMGDHTLLHAFLERKKGHVRFAGQYFVVFKGGKLEAQYLPADLTKQNRS